MTYIAAFIVSLVYVFVKAYQQKNVQHDQFWSVPLCSFPMAFMEVGGMFLIVKSGSIWIALSIGTGSTIGCWLAMYLHKRLRNVSDGGDNQQGVADARGENSGGINGELGNDRA